MDKEWIKGQVISRWGGEGLLHPDEGGLQGLLQCATGRANGLLGAVLEGLFHDKGTGHLSAEVLGEGQVIYCLGSGHGVRSQVIG